MEALELIGIISQTEDNCHQRKVNIMLVKNEPRSITVGECVSIGITCDHNITARVAA